MINLKRADLVNKFYGYYEKNNIVSEKEVRKYLDMIKEYLEKRHYESNESYLLSDRKKVCL